MKKSYLFFLVLTFTVLSSQEIIQAQNRDTWVNQVISINGGKNESPPYTDYVTVQSYFPTTQVVDVFDVIYTQSAQDVVISGNFAYVAAQDSIVMYNINTYQRVAAIADSGLSRLAVYKNRLVVTKKFPVTRFFVEILDATNLALIARISDIPGDCGGAIAALDTVFVAVNGGMFGTEGKMAIINTGNWTLKRIVNFGAEAVGAWEPYSYAGKIFSVNRTPFGAPNVGSITVYDIFNQYFINKVMGVKIGSGIGLQGDKLYVKMNEGVGSFDMNSLVIVDTTIIPDPGFANHISIIAGAVDYVNNYMYLNIGNQLSFGIGIVSTLTGDSVTAFAQGINNESIAIDYRTPTSIETGVIKTNTLSIFPNPANDFLKIRFQGTASSLEITITDITGNIILREPIKESTEIHAIDVSMLSPGIYFLTLKTGSDILTRKFIKH